MDPGPFRCLETVLQALVTLGFAAELTESGGSNQWWEYAFVYRGGQLRIYVHRNEFRVDFNRADHGFNDEEFTRKVEDFLTDPTLVHLLSPG